MRAVITAGGTAGHIHPAIAIADEIMKNEPDSQILFIGRRDGMEQSIVSSRGYRLAGIDVHGFMRRITFRNILFNIRSLLYILIATRESKRILKEFKPDIVIGCGGYVSGPVVRAAAKKGIKTVIQEQNSYPGITTKLLERYVNMVFCADIDGVSHLKYKDKAIVTGNPIKEEYFKADRNLLRNRYDVGDRVFVLSYGGSNGSEGLNAVVAAFMSKHYKSNRVFHVHATGQYAKESFERLVAERHVDYENCSNIKVFEYIPDIADYYAACDLVISRAGALTISEIKAVGRASVLIPSPNVTENHQLYNALSLARIDSAYVFEEGTISVDDIAERIMLLTRDREKLVLMGENAKKYAEVDASGKIYRYIHELLDGD